MTHLKALDISETGRNLVLALFATLGINVKFHLVSSNRGQAVLILRPEACKISMPRLRLIPRFRKSRDWDWDWYQRNPRFDAETRVSSRGLVRLGRCRESRRPLRQVEIWFIHIFWATFAKESVDLDQNWWCTTAFKIWKCTEFFKSQVL